MNDKKVIACVLALVVLCGTLTAALPLYAVTKDQAVNTAVQMTTGVNPADHPCAKNAIVALYQSREKVQKMRSYDPRKLWVSARDTVQYYFIKAVHFVQGMLHPQNVQGHVQKGMHTVRGIATSNDPAGTVRHQFSQVMGKLSSRAQFVTQHKVAKLIKGSTNPDGSCKKVED